MGPENAEQAVSVGQCFRRAARDQLPQGLEGRPAEISEGGRGLGRPEGGFVCLHRPATHTHTHTHTQTHRVGGLHTGWNRIGGGVECIRRERGTPGGEPGEGMPRGDVRRASSCRAHRGLIVDDPRREPGHPEDVREARRPVPRGRAFAAADPPGSCSGSSGGEGGEDSHGLGLQVV